MLDILDATAFVRWTSGSLPTAGGGIPNIIRFGSTSSDHFIPREKETIISTRLALLRGYTWRDASSPVTGAIRAAIWVRGLGSAARSSGWK